MKQVLVLTSLLFGACVGTEIPGPPVQQQPDAPVKIYEDAPPPPPDMGPAAGCAERNATPPQAYIHPQSGTPRAGEGCTSGEGCHRYGHSANQKAFVLGGTLYKPGTNEPDPGATILIYPDGAAATPIPLVTDTAGNFWLEAEVGGGGTTAIVNGQAVPAALPASAAATVCPTLVKGHLSGKLLANNARDGGNCNGCHKTEVNDPGTQSAIHY